MGFWTLKRKNETPEERTIRKARAMQRDAMTYDSIMSAFVQPLPTFSQWTAQARDQRLHVEADKAGPNCDIDLANCGHFSGGLRDGNARQSESFLVGVSTISHSRKWNRNGQGIGH